MINSLMVKFHVAIICFLFFNSISYCSRPTHFDTDEEKERAMVIQHKIRSITEYRTSVFLGVKQQEKFSQRKYFDDNGFIVNETNYNLDGIIDCILNYEYDKNGNVIATNAKNNDSSFLFRETKSYDENNNRKELYFFLPDGSYKYRNVSAFDKEGRMMELSWYWPTGFKAKDKFEYEGRKKISDTEYDAKGMLSYKWIYKFDSKENLIEAIQYSPSETTIRKINYEFNEKNQLVKETSYTGEDIQNSNVFFYNEKDLLLKKTVFSSSGKIITEFRYQYEFR